MAHDVFISYSAKNKPVADAVCAALEQAGIRCWIAPRDMVAGQNWAGGIVRAIGASRVLVLILSADSNSSPHVRQEIERAMDKGAAIIPFRIEDVAPSDELAYFIGSRHWIDAVTPPLQKHIGILTEQVKGYVAVDPGPGAPAAAVRRNNAVTEISRRRSKKPAVIAAGAAMAGLLAGAAAMRMGWIPNPLQNNNAGNSTKSSVSASQPLPPLDLSTPGKTVIVFLNALFSGDAETIHRTASGTDGEFATADLVSAQLSSLTRLGGAMEKKFGDKTWIIDRSRLTDEVEKWGDARIDGSHATIGEFKLRKEGNNWQVDLALMGLDDCTEWARTARLASQAIDDVTRGVQSGSFKDIAQVSDAVTRAFSTDTATTRPSFGIIRTRPRATSPGARDPGLLVAVGPTVGSCKGLNTCKGQGACKTSDHGCKGKNACKGQGACKVSSSATAPSTEPAPEVAPTPVVEDPPPADVIEGGIIAVEPAVELRVYVYDPGFPPGCYLYGGFYFYAGRRYEGEFFRERFVRFNLDHHRYEQIEENRRAAERIREQHRRDFTAHHGQPHGGPQTRPDDNG